MGSHLLQMVPRLVAAILLLCLASVSQAAEVHLRQQLDAVPTAGGWTWLELRDPQALREMPENWQLAVDQVRFSEIAIVATTTDGRMQTIARTANRLENNWGAGGVLKFSVTPSGKDIRGLAIGFRDLDDLALMRKVTAATPARAAELEGRWLILMGVFAGLMVSAFAYNLLVHAGQRSVFQRIYLGWVAVALAYGLTWSNLTSFAFPGLVGPVAVRLDNVLVGSMIALACLFLLAVLEDRTVPRLLILAVRISSAACILAGLAAADERIIPAHVGDLALNLAMITSVGLSVAVMAAAAARGSRVVWLYLAGWAPVIGVFALRAARNFGLVQQSDLVDMATFAAIGFESLVFSLAIASRFVTLRKERDAAEASARGMEIERETLQRAAHSDFLTGLGNRASFHEHLRQLFARNATFTLMLIDVDHLKELNDRQGHDAGDALLQHIGQSLGRLTSSRVACARIGGDEFAILVEDELGERLLLTAALDRLQGSAWSLGNWSGSLSLSIGTAGSPGATSPTDLFQQADLALYEAKRLGRGRRLEFDGRLRLQTQTRLDLIKQAHWGLRHGEFALHFQPIVDLETGRHVSVEALLRWNHPTRGMLTPETFACVMEDGQIGAAVQQRVLEMAFAELQRRPPGDDATLAVNFTAMDLQGAASARRLLRKLERAGIPPSALCIEVTEGVILAKAGNAPTTALRVLHDAGVQIALDDFGTGYASLVHLREIPVDTLKLDRSFVAGLLRDGDESEEIVRAVLALGHGLKKRVVAEGIETPGQLIRLRDLGCRFGQGFLFARPSPAYDRSAIYLPAVRNAAA